MNRRQRLGLYAEKMRMEYMRKAEEKYPGYLDEREKLYTLVFIFTGVRLIYSLFYLGISLMYGLSMTEGIVNLFSTAVFYFWYNLMLQSGWGVAALMLVARGIGLAMGGAGLLGNAPWLVEGLSAPIALVMIFTIVMGMVMQFFEAVFCIYIMFNSWASTTVKLNRQMIYFISRQEVSKETIGRMAGYRNEEAESDEAESEQMDSGDQTQEEKEDKNEKFT